MIHLRVAVAADVPLIMRFVRELADYEREPEAVVATEADLLRDGFGEAPRFHVLIAEWEGAPVGFAFYFFQYSTWTGRPVLYLEDLFVSPSHRSRGIGVELMKRLAKEAVAKDCSRFQWSVLDWNAPSIAFYESLGAKVHRDWLAVRIDGDALLTLSGGRALP
ncbi:MAG: GNAT family N-acetyltransferase [Polyangiaceae bacterium]